MPERLMYDPEVTINAHFRLCTAWKMSFVHLASLEDGWRSPQDYQEVLRARGLLYHQFWAGRLSEEARSRHTSCKEGSLALLVN